MVVKVVLYICSCLSITSSVEFLVSYVRNCDDVDSVIKIINSSVHLSFNGDVDSSTCSQIRPYQTALINTKLFKNSVTVFDGKNDICHRANKANDYYRILQALYGIPPNCPVTSDSQTYCFNNSKVATVSPPTMKFMPVFFAGSKSIEAKTVLTHDTGISCFEAGFIMK